MQSVQYQIIEFPVVEDFCGRFALARPVVEREERVRRVVQRMDEFSKAFISQQERGKVLKNVSLSRVLSLGDLLAVRGTDVFSQVVGTLDLALAISAVEAQYPLFFEQVGGRNWEILDRISLLAVQRIGIYGVRESLVELAMMGDEEIARVAVSQVKSDDQLSLLAFRIGCVYQTRKEWIEGFKKPWAPWWFSRDSLPLARLPFLTGAAVAEMRETLPPRVFGLLSEHQLAEVSFAQLDSESIDACLRGVIGDGATIEKRFLALSTPQILDVLKKMPDDLFRFLPMKCFRAIQGMMREMDSLTISKLLVFPTIPEWIKQERVQQLSIDQINGLIERRFVGFLHFATEEQFSSAQVHLAANCFWKEFFPPVEPACLFPGLEYERRDVTQGGVTHLYKGPGSIPIAIRDKEIQLQIEDHGRRRRKYASRLTVQQQRLLKGALQASCLGDRVQIEKIDREFRSLFPGM